MTRVSKTCLKASESLFSTPLGEMIALTTESSVIWLSFIKHEKSKQHYAAFKKKFNVSVISEKNALSLALEKYCVAYFAGKSVSITLPLNALGTPFQQRVWAALQTIPIGETRSYGEVAATLKHPKAYRAVANANGKNPICLLIPCHRVINANGSLGGYSGGVEIKAALLQRESTLSFKNNFSAG